MRKRCLIISGGDWSPIPAEDREDLFVIACDRGYEHALRAGIVPDLFVGDFDSYHGLVPPEVPVLELPVAKDDTDTMAAVRYGVEHGASHIILCCSMGGRLDHAYANIQSALFAVQHGLQAEISEQDVKISFVRDASIALPHREGWSLSVFAMTEVCTGVTIQGTRYPLEDGVLTNAFPLGVSNEWASPTARITVGHGIVMVMECRMPRKEIP